MRKRVAAGQKFGQLEKVAAAFRGFRPASQVLTAVRAVPTRFIQVDHALRCGGWPVERFTLVHGPSNMGKTICVLGLIASFLERGHLAHYQDAERTTPFPWARGLIGPSADLPSFTADRPESYEGTIASTRNYLNTIIKLKERGDLAPETSALIVCDSLRKLVPRDMMKEILSAERADAKKAKEVIEKQQTKSGKVKEGGGWRAQDILGGRDRSAQLKAKMNAAWMDELVPHLEKAGAGFVAIGRELQDPDADQWAKKFGNDYKVGGGGAIYFDASVVARVERAAWVDNGVKESKNRVVYGERHRVTIKKTKVGGKDGKVALAYFHSSNGNFIAEGFDRARDVLELGERVGVIERTASWHSFEGERIAAGRDNAVKVLTANPEWLGRIEAATRKQFGAAAPLEINEETGEVEP